MTSGLAFDIGGDLLAEGMVDFGIGGSGRKQPVKGIFRAHLRMPYDMCIRGRGETTGIDDGLDHHLPILLVDGHQYGDKTIAFEDGTLVDDRVIDAIEGAAIEIDVIRGDPSATGDLMVLEKKDVAIIAKEDLLFG